jgi:hypothetical protein
MKYIYYTVTVFTVAMVLAFLSAGCSINKELVQFSNGKNGSNGKDGKDGSNAHSLVGLVVEYLESCKNGGTALDLYLDLDDSLSVTEGDLFQGQLLACNGSNGQDGLDGENGSDGEDGEDGEDGSDGLTGPVGPMGPQGPAGSPGASVTITTYSTSSCTAISGSVYYVKLNNIYSSSSCSSNTKVAELTGSDDTFWVSSTKLAVENGSSSIRVINY